MNIFYIVIKGMPFGGGIEKYTEEVGSRLVAKGHNVTVYTMPHYGTRPGIYRGMQIKTVPTIGSKSFEKIIAAFTATVRCLGEKDADIVHFHAFGPAMFCGLARLFGRKVVVQGHGIEWHRARWGLFGRTFLRLSEIPSIRLPHVVTAVSRVQQRYVRNVYGRDCTYIPTGVNPPRREPPDQIRQFGLKGNDYILFAARLVREKGAHYLLEAFRKIDAGLKLVIAGDAPHEDLYKSELRRLAGNDDRIVFTGHVSGKLLDELYSNCYVFVHPSEVEGLSTALLEAMSFGNCCLASDIEENKEALNGCGYLFQNKSREDLAAKLGNLLGDTEAVSAMKQKAKARVLQEFAWDDIADRFEKLYISLLRRSANKG